MRRIIKFTLFAVVLTIAFAAPLAGTAAADDHAPHGVNIETDSLSSGANETIAVAITNDQDSDMVSPIVEIPLRNGLSIKEANRSMRGDTEFIVDADENDAATVTNESGLNERRRAFVESSTLRGGDAVFIEGVVVPSDETRTYSVPIHISGESSITLEADTRPLNNEANNNKTQKTIDPVGQGTISIQAGNSDDEISISGTGVDTTVTGSEDLDLPGDETYTVNTTLDDSVGKITLDGVDLDELETQPIQFTDPDASGTLSPTVVARTGGQADVDGGSTSRDTTLGTATANTTQTVTFDLSASGGQTVVAVGTQSELPMRAIDGVTGFSDRSFDDDAAQLKTDGAVDGETVSVTFEGRKLGNVDGDTDVDSDDAVEIAEKLAADNGDSLTDYADVTDSDSVSAVDAMQIQQYTEGNRTADYAVNGGT